MNKWENLSFIKKGKEFVFIIHSIKRLVRKSLATFCSTSLQHLSTCGGSHSLTETVYFALLSFLGLISSFHDLFS